jgi:inhibitor of KinA sporulation pathway (predicted exonuclease)
MGCKVPEMEIIEIGAVWLEGDTFQPMADLEQFVKPAKNPMLTEFCRNLTHIKQGQIDSAPCFAEAFDAIY